MSSTPDRARRAFSIGLALYVVSFFVVAVGPYPREGYRCALAALAFPITEPENPTQPATWFDRVSLRFAAINVSGLINVVFALAVVTGLITRGPGLFKALRVLVLLMIPVCWIVFHNEQLYPREGHYMWILGMILVLFSKELGSWLPPRALGPAV